MPVLSLVENLFLQKNSLQDLLSNLNDVISTNESTEFITVYVIYNPAYIYLQIPTENHLGLGPQANHSQLREAK